jgi:hypothetical protein
MKRMNKLTPLLLAWGLALSVLWVSAGPANAQAIVSSEASDGTVELSNTAGSGEQAPLAPESGAAVATEIPAAPAEAEPAKDPRELYRDLVMQVPEVVPAGTSAASRRYKKVDLATYRALMQGKAVQPAQ